MILSLALSKNPVTFSVFPVILFLQFFCLMCSDYCEVYMLDLFDKKLRPSIFIALAFCILASTLSCRQADGASFSKTIDIKPEIKELASFKEFGTLVRVVQLETTERSLISNISQVHLDPTSDDIFIVDQGNSHQLMKFGNEGTFKKTVGRKGEGPSEYQKIVSASVFSNGDLVIVGTQKLIRFNKDGAFVNEVFLSKKFIPSYSVVGRDQLYVLAMASRDPNMVDEVYTYDGKLNPMGSFGPYDARKSKYIYSPTVTLAFHDDLLYVNHFYDLSMSVYHMDGTLKSTWVLPNSNHELDVIWEKDKLQETDRTKIKRHLHRFEKVYPYKSGLLLLEYSGKEKSYFVSKFSPSFGGLTRYYGYQFYDFNKEDPEISVGLVGSYQNGVIGIIDDVSRFHLFKDRYPALEGLEMTELDNPILVFLDLH